MGLTQHVQAAHPAHFEVGKHHVHGVALEQGQGLVTPGAVSTRHPRVVRVSAIACKAPSSSLTTSKLHFCANVAIFRPHRSRLCGTRFPRPIPMFCRTPLLLQSPQSTIARLCLHGYPFLSHPHATYRTRVTYSQLCNPMWPGINGHSPTLGPTPTMECVAPMLTAGTYS